MSKEYIGDAVYVRYEGDHYVLTTENGMGETNTIYLEPMVFNALIDFKKRIECNEKKDMEQEIEHGVIP